MSWRGAARLKLRDIFAGSAVLFGQAKNAFAWFWPVGNLSNVEGRWKSAYITLYSLLRDFHIHAIFNSKDVLFDVDETIE